MEGMTDSQAAACEADTDKRRVLLAREKGLEKMLFDLCRQGFLGGMKGNCVPVYNRYCLEIVVVKKNWRKTSTVNKKTSLSKSEMLHGCREPAIKGREVQFLESRSANW